MCPTGYLKYTMNNNGNIVSLCLILQVCMVLTTITEKIYEGFSTGNQ